MKNVVLARRLKLSNQGDKVHYKVELEKFGFDSREGQLHSESDSC